MKNNRKEMKVNNQENKVNLFENILGKNVVKFANEANEKIEVISSGSIGLDQALGIGGYPVGKIIEIFGNESSGKTTISLQAIKEAQLKGKKCLFIDVENSLDINYANKIGIDTSKLLVAHPNSGEQVFDVIELLIKSNQVDFIVVDSVAAMIPLAEVDANYEEQQMGLHARLMSKGMRKLQSILMHNECTIIFINQIREKIGVFFGNPETTTGGKALKFFSSVRLETRKADLIKDENNKIGVQAKVTVIKNKLAAPLKSAFIDIYFENGFNYNNEIIDFAIKYDVIKKSGSWFYYQEQKLGQGREQLKKYLNENNEIFESIKNETLNQLN